MSYLQSRWLAPALLLAGLSCNLYAVDGVVLIDQNRALAGGVTPGDAPGFPVTISVAGSYRLSGNLTMPNATTNAIEINANNVTIDLNGFSIVGPTICVAGPGGGAVISCSPTGGGTGVLAIQRRNVTVVNGTVRGMGTGIDLGSTVGGYIEKVHADSNSSGGISVFDSGVLNGNTANGNGGIGINVNASTVTGNVANSNGGTGINAFCPSSIVGNTAASNGGGNISTNGAGCAVANNAAP
jgi:hypothetical protein